MKIILIGFMGSGKTVVGKYLAKRLNIDFIDMDEEIERREKSSIENIFSIKGEDYFRNIESNLLSEVIKKDNIVVSTGGGIIKNNNNCNILEREDTVIFLNANVNTIIKNVSYDLNKRPLLKESKNLTNTVEDLLEDRIEKYKKVSDIEINVNAKNINDVISQILVSIQ